MQRPKDTIFNYLALYRDFNKVMAKKESTQKLINKSHSSDEKFN